MIKVDKVEYGIAPIGADIGMPCFAIHLGNDDTGGLGIDKLDPEKDTDKIRDTFYNKAVDLFNTIEEGIKALGKEDTWLECLTQPKYKEYIYLIGKVITDDEYFYVVNMLLQVISAKSRDIQNMIHESGKPIELCAPKFAMIAYPNSPYLQKNIWEACNFIMSWLPKELDGERLDFMNKNKFYHIIVLQILVNTHLGHLFILLIQKMILSCLNLFIKKHFCSHLVEQFVLLQVIKKSNLKQLSLH